METAAEGERHRLTLHFDEIISSSLNTSQINLKKKFISRHILHQHWYTCPIALPIRRNPQHRSIFDCCLSHFRISVSTSSSAKRLPPSCEPLYATNTSNHKQNMFLYESPLHRVLLPTKTINRTLLFGGITSGTVTILTTETSLETCACVPVT
jgi:hypothetical protein